MKTPVLDLLSLEELQELVVHRLLARQGIENPAQFMEDNQVNYVVALRPQIGVAVTVSSIGPKKSDPRKSEEPPAA